ncbi:MAG: winged helix-turn-helix domain-containing protein [Chloroflexi bacterium]|nr:winged helix-turn-helix domain-containing protein [Chloroflexota bacterium]
MAQLPKSREFYNPTLQALHKLGRDHREQVYKEVARIMRLSEEQLAIPGRRNGGGIEKFKAGHRTAWALNRLRELGLATSDKRGVWWLTDEGKKTQRIGPY